MTTTNSLDLPEFDAGLVVKGAADADILSALRTNITPQQGVGSYVIQIAETDAVFVPEGGQKSLTSVANNVKIGNAKIVASAKYTIEALANVPALEAGFMTSFPGQIARSYSKTVLGLSPLPAGAFDSDFHTLAGATEVEISLQDGLTLGDKAIAAFDTAGALVTNGEVTAYLLTTAALSQLATFRNTTTGVRYFEIDRVAATINGVPYVTVKSTVFAVFVGDWSTLVGGVAVYENGESGTQLYKEFFGGVGLNNEHVFVQEVFVASGTTDADAIVKIVF
jgi:hypothetical protein